jgi:hypothetical protein
MWTPLHTTSRICARSWVELQTLQKHSIHFCGMVSYYELWDLGWTKWRWGRFSPSTSVSPANLHSTNFSTITIIYHLGLVQYASSGRSTKWTQSHPTNNNNKKIVWAIARKRSWLRHYATSQKVAGAIPDEVVGLFNWSNPSSRIVALRSAQLLTEMSLPGGKKATGA